MAKSRIALEGETVGEGEAAHGAPRAQEMGSNGEPMMVEDG